MTTAERKHPHRSDAIKRILLIWAIQAVALIIASLLMPKVEITNVGAAIIAAAVIGILNAVLWPILSYILIPFAVLTLGLAALLMNGLIIWLASLLVEGFSVTDFWGAFWLALLMAAINLILSSLLTIDDDNSWYRNQVQRRMKRVTKPEETDVPGIIFLEIDGLARPILEKALKEGLMPTLQSWIERGSHVLTGWETDTSSQTSASQAGILHGDNSNIPAFRWYDKSSGQIIASSNSKLLPEIEKERSDGNGLLCDDGASRGNLFTGDAKYVMATASALRDRSKFHTSEFQAYIANPYNVSRTLFLFLWDIILEKRQYRNARKNNVEPLLEKDHRGGIYPIIRGVMTVVMRELNIYTLIGDIFSGRSSAYATFVGYDEIAHHSGILDPGAFDILRKLDQQFHRLESALPQAPRPYHLVILSDHGQTGGATFRQRYGPTLEEYIQELMTEDVTVGSIPAVPEGWGHINTMLTDTIHNEDSGVSSAVARIFKKQTIDGEVKLGPEAEVARKQAAIQSGEEEKPAVVALASGNLGLISFTEISHRLSLEEINEAFPAVIPGLANHEGIGFIMVRSQENGPVVIGANGSYYLDDDRIEGENPLALFGPNAPTHLKRTDSFPNCPDILVNSFYKPENNEGCAFEELIGFHGGLGGTQSSPFLLHPVELEVDGKLIGAASVYRACKGWLTDLQNIEPTS